MKLLIERREFNKNSTQGKLYVNGVYLADTLEPTDRGLDAGMTSTQIADIKINGKTAIPYGNYAITLEYSPRFKRILPTINDVKCFEGVRIHAGNSYQDTAGCVLLGERVQKDIIANSRQMVDRIQQMIVNSIEADEGVTLQIVRI